MSSSEFDPTYPQLIELFPIPLLKYVWPNSEELNNELARVILSKEKEGGGIEATNVGGWHSKRNLQEWDDECVITLLLRIEAMAREMVKRSIGTCEQEHLSGWKIQAWANVSRYGHFNKHHNHTRYSLIVQRKLRSIQQESPSVGGDSSEMILSSFNLWSGVYYVDIGTMNSESSEGARIVFADENSIEVSSREEYKRRYSVLPESGLMLLFPSSLGHSVEPYYGLGSRVTVAFNLSHPKFTTIDYEIKKRMAEGHNERTER